MKTSLKLIDLLKKNAWLSVEAILLTLYPEEAGNRAAYEEIFHKLQILTPSSQNISILITTQTDDFDNTTYIDVSGRYNNPADNTEDFEVSLALEFSPWAHWLGMDIAEESLKSFTELEILAHTLYEITFVSFDEEEIQEQIKQVSNEMKAYKNMTEEEKRRNTLTLDELKKRLDSEDADGE